jgi:Glycosyl hydrolase family 10
VNAKSNAVYAKVKDFKRRGVPIDGVGLRMHLFDLNPDIASIAASSARFTALGVQVHLTELDVALPTNPNREALKAADLERQSEIYGSSARACLSHPGSRFRPKVAPPSRRLSRGPFRHGPFFLCVLCGFPFASSAVTGFLRDTTRTALPL